VLLGFVQNLALLVRTFVISLRHQLNLLLYDRAAEVCRLFPPHPRQQDEQIRLPLSGKVLVDLDRQNGVLRVEILVQLSVHSTSDELFVVGEGWVKVGLEGVRFGIAHLHEEVKNGLDGVVVLHSRSVHAPVNFEDGVCEAWRARVAPLLHPQK
jgi:hypothetical protein